MYKIHAKMNLIGEQRNIMYLNSNSRNGFIHLYNPKKEGLGPYDVNYINAYKKIKISKNKPNNEKRERHAA